MGRWQVKRKSEEMMEVDKAGLGKEVRKGSRRMEVRK